MRQSRVFAAVNDRADAHAPRHAMPLSKTTQYLQITRDYENTSRAMIAIPQALLVGMVSQHDAFTGKLTRALFNLCPELLKTIERPVTFRDLHGLSMDDLRYKMVEEEIGSVLRKSHTDQLGWLATRLGIKLDGNAELIEQFVEVTQRRHLYAHTDGIVTNQYVSECSSNFRADVPVGEPLALDQEYFEHAYSVLYEIAVKLSQVTWRKLRPSERPEADEILARVCYRLLVLEQFELARVLLRYAVDLRHHSSEHTKRIFVINLAQAHKWLGDDDGCIGILDEHDWTACENSFALSEAVLRGEFEKARHLMLEVGHSKDVTKAGFEDWPVYREFRSTPQFADAYQQLFGSGIEPNPV